MIKIAKLRDGGIVRTSPEFKLRLIKLAGEKQILEGRRFSIPDITKEIIKCPSWKKTEEELSLNKKEFDLRR
jgi:hypothetical protein